MKMTRRALDASSSSSRSSNWSATNSLSVVYEDDPIASWTYPDIKGGVTRRDDERDDRRTRFAVHFLRGPFGAGGRKFPKKRSSNSGHHHTRRRDVSDTRSDCSSGSSSSSEHSYSDSGHHRQQQRPFPPEGPPPPPPHHHHPSYSGPLPPQHHPNQYPNQFSHGRPIVMGAPPSRQPPPPQPGFEAGFIQIGGGGRPPLAR